jgi:hypothetical protein
MNALPDQSHQSIDALGGFRRRLSSNFALFQPTYFHPVEYVSENYKGDPGNHKDEKYSCAGPYDHLPVESIYQFKKNIHSRPLESVL